METVGDLKSKEDALAADVATMKATVGTALTNLQAKLSALPVGTTIDQATLDAMGADIDAALAGVTGTAAAAKAADPGPTPPASA